LAGTVAGATSSARRLAGGIVPRFREGNLDDRDTDAMRELLPAMWLMASAWFRPDIRGLERIPRQGPALIVGNHTGGTSSPEVLISQLAFSAYFGVERPHYQLAHRMVLNSPVGSIVRRFGTVEADPANAEAALKSGAMVTVFPGGRRSDRSRLGPRRGPGEPHRARRWPGDRTGSRDPHGGAPRSLPPPPA